MSLLVEIESLGMGPRPLLLNTKLSIASGEVLTVMGESGCGKSTLLSAIAGLSILHLRFMGRVTLNDRPLDALPTSARRIGLLFQDDLLFPHMSVRENLLFAVPPGTKRARAESADAALAELGFEAMAHRSPLTLSGGQRARVSLMRTLLAEPHAVLLDEPFSKLDASLREHFRHWVFERIRARALPALLVTHDAADAYDATRIWRWPDLPAMNPLDSQPS